MRARTRWKCPSPQSGPERIGQADLFFEVSMPPAELVIFGAGFDAEPLARLGWELGFAVTVVDAREAFLTADRFPRATLVSAHFGRFADAIRLSARSLVVIMNHHLERDRECLRFALAPRRPSSGCSGRDRGSRGCEPGWRLMAW